MKNMSNNGLPDNIAALAQIICQDWQNIHFAARPYLQAMLCLDRITDDYGEDSGASVVAYFLANARTWKGQTAIAVKAKLNQLVKSTYTKQLQTGGAAGQGAHE